MPCRTVGNSIICGPVRKFPVCSVCGAPGGWLCDYELGKGKTCDRSLCSSHRRPQADSPGTDLCPAHDALAFAASAVADEAG